jgi:hypothetical protein
LRVVDGAVKPRFLGGARQSDVFEHEGLRRPLRFDALYLRQNGGSRR